MAKYTLYALFDEREPEHVRYVGFTSSTKDRLTGHIAGARREAGKPTYKVSWIRCLLFDGLKPSLRVLETVETLEEAFLREIALISEHKKAGHRLTNSTDGGDASDGLYWGNPEARERQRQAMESHWSGPEGEEHRRLNVEANKRVHTGSKKSPEAREKMAEAKRGKPGVPRTEEWKKRIGDKQRGTKRRSWTSEERERRTASMNKPETRAKMSASAKARTDVRRTSNGQPAWNKGMQMSEEFRQQCVEREAKKRES